MLCDPHMGGGIKYCDWTGHIGYVVSLYVLLFGCVIYDSDCTVRTGHVVSVVSLICRLWDLI